jgi:hypothetical protein
MTMDGIIYEPPLPCPYCGSEAILENNPYGGPTIYVRCTNDRCLACGPEYDHDGSRWNAVARAVQGAKTPNRSTHASLQELVEAIHHPKRIPVQITAGVDHSLYALCSDSSIWKHVPGVPGWHAIDELPDQTPTDTTS